MWLLLELLSAIQNLTGLRFLWQQVRQRPYLFSTLFVVAALLAAGYVTAYVRYIHPARSTVAEFFEAIDEERYDAAWELLDEDFQQRWHGGLEQFKHGYGTTVKHTDVAVSDTFSLYQLQNVLFNRCMALDVRYRVIDRFDRDVLADPMQYSNRLSLELRHPARYRQLVDGELPNAESTVELTRIYEKHATVSKKRGKWRISSLRSRFVTFDYQTR